MFDLQIMAYRADLTRVFSMIMARELSGRTYPMIGIPGQHHLISHHRDDAELMSQKARIDTYHVQMLAYLLEKMQATPDGDGSLLDHSLIMYGSGMGNGNLHRHSDMPVLLAGKLGGKFKTGYHLDYKMDTPMANLLVTILDKAGVPIEKLGDSTGPLKLEAISRLRETSIMSEKTSRRSLLQKTALAAGAAALLTKKVASPGRRPDSRGRSCSPPAFAMSGSRPRAPRSTRSSVDLARRCCCSTALRIR